MGTLLYMLAFIMMLAISYMACEILYQWYWRRFNDKNKHHTEEIRRLEREWINNLKEHGEKNE